MAGTERSTLSKVTMGIGGATMGLGAIGAAFCGVWAYSLTKDYVSTFICGTAFVIGAVIYGTGRALA